MVLDHLCKINGVWYEAGSEVDLATNTVHNETVEEQKTYSKDEINRMPYFGLKQLAKANNVECTNAKQMREDLIKKLEL